MNPRYTIKNFRVFDREGATFELAPLTILTGCNSSGKSSMVKSMLLLDRYLQKVRNGIKEGKCQPEEYPLEFFGIETRLGSFKDVFNKTADADEPISFAINTRANLANMCFVVEFSFKESSKDLLNNGRLSSLVIRLEDGTIILRAEVKDGILYVSKANLLPLRQSFFKYLYYSITEHIFSVLQSDNIIGNLTKEERASLEETFNLCKVELKKNLERSDYESFKKSNRDLIPYFTNNIDLLDSVLAQRTLFVMPVLSKLADARKENIMDRVSTLFSDDEKSYPDERRRYYLNRIAKDFMESEFESFLQYFTFWEEKEGMSSFNQLGGGYKMETGFFSIISSYISSGYNTYTDDEITDYYISNFWDDNSRIEIDYDEGSGKRQQEAEREEWRKTRDSESVSFNMILRTILSCCTNNLSECKRELLFDEWCPISFSNKSYDLFKRYFSEIIKEVLTPSYFDTIEYVGSAAVTVKRLYSFDAGEDTLENKLKKYVNLRNNYRGRSFEPGSFINDWLKKFGIGKSLSFDFVKEGLGLVLHLHSEDDIEEHLLADEGYGITQLLSTLISVEIQIMSKKSNSTDVDKEALFPVSTMSIEEPEIHLHPRFQSLLAEMFVEAYKKYNIHFIIETHSEYLIRKLQTYIPLAEINEKEGLKQEEISLYYLYNPNPTKRPKKEPQVKKIGFRKDGSLNSPFGSGFFDEADNLAMSLLIGNY